MNTHVKKLWINALRRGTYQQGRYHLRLEATEAIPYTRYCCLGVLTELARRRGVITRFNPNGAFLPQKVAAWAGLPHCSGKTSVMDAPHHVQTQLTRLNDGIGAPSRSFNQIATWIAKEL